MERAIDAAAAAWHDWAALPWEERAAVFLRAAELLAGPWRDTLNAATMLGQSKTAHQAEIDAACELIDFLRFNVELLPRLYAEQPHLLARLWNRWTTGRSRASCSRSRRSTSRRSPATSPPPRRSWATPSSGSRLDAMALGALHHAALRGGRAPARRHQLRLRARRRRSATPRSRIPHLAGIHFTGSTAVFQGDVADGRRATSRATGTTRAWSARPAARTSSSRTRRRLDALATAIVRGAFEYQGQKCSAASRLYVAVDSGRQLASGSSRRSASIKMGDVADFGNFMGAVIDDAAFETQREAIEEATRIAEREGRSPAAATDDAVGYFVAPTLIETNDPELPAHARRALRAGADLLRLPRRATATRRSSCRLDGSVRAHRRGLREIARVVEATTRSATPPATST